MDDKPRIRPIEAFPVQQDGKTLIYLKDPLNLATPIGISPVGYFLLAHLDGHHSFVDIQAAYNQRFGALLMSDELKGFVDMLDQHYYLESERFQQLSASEVIVEFRRLPTRAPAHVGGGYKSEPVELTAQLDSYFLAPKGPGLPSAANDAVSAQSNRRAAHRFSPRRPGLRLGLQAAGGKRRSRSLHYSRHVPLRRPDALYSHAEGF